MKVLIEQSNSNQKVEGEALAILQQPEPTYCPVRSLNDCLTVREVESGALFRRIFRFDKVGEQTITAQTIALMITDLAYRVSLDKATYVAHSLRSGLLTSAAKNRATAFQMANQSHHKSLDVLRKLVRAEKLFEDSVEEGLLK